MKIKKTMREVFSELYSVGMLIILLPLLIIVGLYFLKDEMDRGNDGEF